MREMPKNGRLVDIVYEFGSLFRQKGTLAMEIQIRSMGVKNMQQEIKMASECVAHTRQGIPWVIRNGAVLMDGA
jgi:hypothetical protein